jgi:predicted TIM-barrel fold metal-dependent hydrolase
VNPQELFRPWLDATFSVFAEQPEIFDAHTHTGFNDPDGMSASLHQLTEMLELVDSRAVFFTMHEPDGYSEANDRVISEAAESGGRMVPFCRVNPHEDAPGEARRALAAGARGIKLHPRAEAFTLDHPQVGELFAIAEEQRVPMLIHAGRGIPALGRHVVQHAERHPGANVILAHAGICDLGWIWRRAAELPNLFFDTAWWNPADLITLCSLVPPGQILYASDAPYGRPVLSVTLATRCALQAGLTEEQLHSVLGQQIQRLLAGEEPLDLGPAPGADAVGPRVIEAERVVSYCASAMQIAFRGLDPTEPLGLARLACRTGRDDEVGALLDYVDGLLAVAQENLAADPETPRVMTSGAMLALTIAGTPTVGVPPVEV